ncbi:MAG: urease accessory protein UreF [Bacillota bacterium]
MSINGKPKNGKMGLTLLQITDSLFPIGGFTQSNGLETYVQRGIVRDTATAGGYLRNTILYNVAHNEGLCLRLAWEYAADKSLERLIALDELVSALKVPMEIRQGSNRLCTRFIKVVCKMETDEMTMEYERLIKLGICSGHYSIAFGMFGYAAGIPKREALTAFLYSTASAVVNNCAKLIPLRQIDGQLILYNSQDIILEAVDRIEKLSMEDLGMCCVGAEIRSMQHEQLYSRLYMS